MLHSRVAECPREGEFGGAAIRCGKSYLDLDLATKGGASASRGSSSTQDDREALASRGGNST